MSSNNLNSENAMYRLAIQKNKNRLQQNQANSVLETDRLTQITEELTYWKKNLLKTEAGAREKIIAKLIKLRAEQTTLIIQNLHESSPVLAKQKTSAIIAAYYADCAKLMAVTKHYTNG